MLTWILIRKWALYSLKMWTLDLHNKKIRCIWFVKPSNNVSVHWFCLWIDIRQICVGTMKIHIVNMSSCRMKKLIWSVWHICLVDGSRKYYIISKILSFITRTQRILSFDFIWVPWVQLYLWTILEFQYYCLIVNLKKKIYF